ncbi:MAG: PIG-L deacetylase family protein [Candidatus Saccharimonas sp.]
MKKLLFGIFAHPDDEAFGPCGTLLQEVSDDTELHLYTLTLGEAGQNPDNVPNLGEIREAEWRAAGAKIGATSLQTLSYPDGHLDNIAMQAVSAKLLSDIRDLIARHSDSIQVEFITLDPNGLTGHIDHIVAARSASYVFHHLKRQGLPLSRIRYYCSSDAQVPEPSIDWIYADKGRSTNEISETVDCRARRDEILAIMQEHRSQRADYDFVVAKRGDDIGLDHFLVAV